MAVEVQYRGDNADAGPSDGVWFDVDPLASPKKQVEIFEDFVEATSLALTGAPPMLLTTDGVGGVMNLDTSGDAIESNYAFLLADGKDFTFECRVQVPVAGSVFRCGIEASSNTDGIRFEVAAESAVLAHNTATGTKDDVIATKAISAATWVKLGFRVRGSGDDAEFTGYADGVKIASAKIGDMNAAAVSSAIMRLHIVSANAAAVYVDWIKAVQLR
jgi:hypothetical protein